MSDKLLEQSEEYKKKHTVKKKRKRLFNFVACIAVFCTTYALILPAITMEKTSYCGYEEHEHTEKCYLDELVCTSQEDGELLLHKHGEECFSQERTLNCTIEEGVGHVHTDECKAIEQVLICETEESDSHSHIDACYQKTESYVCGQEETEGHAHEDACYELQNILICEMEETAEDLETVDAVELHEHTDTCYEKKCICEKEEHEHSLICYSDKKADLETTADWEATLPSKLSGVWAEDVINIAKSQLGYTESSKNYDVTADGRTLGYTRFGEWYGDAYGDWCAMFVSFCLNYAEVDQEVFPYDCNCQNWIKTLSEETYDFYRVSGEYEPCVGDLVFFDWDEDEKAEHIGLVAEIILPTKDEETQVRVIEGNSSDCVQYVTYDLEDSQILGYGQLPVNPETVETSLAKQTVEAVIYTDKTFTSVDTEDHTIITVSGYLPEGTTAKAYPVQLEDGYIEGKEVMLAYDITIYDAEGNLIEETTTEVPMTVTIQPANWGKSSEDCTIYYVPEEGEPEAMETSGEEDAVIFRTEHFSTYALVLDGNMAEVYLNGTSGNDSNAGTKAAPVQTLDRALALLADGGTIYITGTVTISNEQVLDVDGTATIKRYAARTDSFTGPLLTVANGGNLSLGNITINGGSGTPSYSDSSPNIAKTSTYASIYGSNNSAVYAKAPLIVVNDGGRLNVGNGAILEYNANKPDSSNNKFVENGYVGLGGAIYCNGMLTMTGGLIQFCEAQCGGGVYVEEGNFYLTGGTIDHNFARDIVSYTSRVGNYHKNAGGGVYIGDNTTMTMSGGTVSYNQSSREGGGISLGWLNRSDNAGIDSYITTFTMNGGTITRNFAVSTGGGLNITAGRQAFINAGYITHNTAKGQEYQDSSEWVSSGTYTSVFSGGGIYIDAAQWSRYASDKHDGVPGKAVINRALITQNTATNSGGGIAACATSVNYIYGNETNGTAIYNNSSNEVYVYNGSLELGDTVLGGGAYNWSGRGTYDNELTDSSAAIVKAKQLATVYIMNNTGYLGGGIGCNGLIEIGGEKEESTYINIKKVWEDDGVIEHPEYIEVQILQDGKPYGEPIRIYRSYDANGNEIWPTFYVGGLPSGHKYTVQELEVPGYMATIEQQGQDFVITNMPVGFRVVKKWLDEDGNELTSNLPDSIEVQLYQNGVEYGEKVSLQAGNNWSHIWANLLETDETGREYIYTVKEVAIPDGFYSTNDAELVDGDWIITNIKSPEISISVEKKWADGTPGAESVTVQLMANGEAYGDSVTLNAENNWFYKWENVPKLDTSGSEITYSIEETLVDGYTASVTEGIKSEATKSWETVTSLESGKEYLLVANGGALAGNDSTGLQLIDVSNVLATGESPDGTVLWTYDGSSLENGNGKYLTTASTGGWSPTYTFVIGSSGSNITFTNGYISTKVGYSIFSATRYLGTISEGSASAVDDTSEATNFTAYELKDSSTKWGDKHFVVTNTEGSKNISVNFAKYATGDKELRLLAGAELALYRQEDSETIIPGTAVSGILMGEWTSKDATHESKGIHVLTLESGTYYLIETKVPEGHAGLEQPIIFEVDAENNQITIIQYPKYEEVGLQVNNGSVDFPIYNEILYKLPETGGIGTNMFTIGGVALVMGSLFVGFMMRHKREERENTI